MRSPCGAHGLYLLSQTHRDIEIFTFSVNPDFQRVTDLGKIHHILDVLELIDLLVVYLDNDIVWQDTGKLGGTTVHQFTDHETMVD